MTDQFAFDDEFYAVPAAAVDADPAATLRDLFYRVGRLEQTLEEERIQHRADWRQTLLEILSMYDAIMLMLDRWGVTKSAQEATMIRSLHAIGKQMLAFLKQHQVEPIATVGKPLDAETSDVAGKEVRDSVAPNTVLREEQIGYVWPYGLLRRAKVVVSTKSAAARVADSTATGQPPAKGT
jgi:molecular chaperone GrpE (heat shock protein)